MNMLTTIITMQLHLEIWGNPFAPGPVEPSHGGGPLAGHQLESHLLLPQNPPMVFRRFHLTSDPSEQTLGDTRSLQHSTEKLLTTDVPVSASTLISWAQLSPAHLGSGEH